MKFDKSLFFEPKNKSLARKISIESPKKFKKSIKELKKGGITVEEKKALTLAKARAKVQLLRPNLSTKEKKQFRTISNMSVPKVNKKR